MRYDEFSNNRGIGSIVIGFVIGGLIGAAAALLMAPQSGEEIRAQIREKSYELRDKARDAIDETTARTEEALSDTLNKAKSRAEDIVQKGQKEVEKQTRRM